MLRSDCFTKISESLLLFTESQTRSFGRCVVGDACEEKTTPKSNPRAHTKVLALQQKVSSVIDSDTDKSQIKRVRCAGIIPESPFRGTTTPLTSKGPSCAPHTYLTMSMKSHLKSSTLSCTHYTLQNFIPKKWFKNLEKAV